MISRAQRLEAEASGTAVDDDVTTPTLIPTQKASGQKPDDYQIVLALNDNNATTWNAGLTDLFGESAVAQYESKSKSKGGSHSSGGSRSSGGHAPSGGTHSSPSRSAPPPSHSSPSHHPSSPPPSSERHAPPAHNPDPHGNQPGSNPPGRGPGNPPGYDPPGHGAPHDRHGNPDPRGNQPGYNPPGRGRGNPPGYDPRGRGPRYDRHPHYAPPHWGYAPPPPRHHDHWVVNINWYPHHTHYRPWYGYVNIVYIDNHPYYRWDGYSGAGINVNSVAELEREKYGVDQAFRDLNPNSPYYQEDTEYVINSYGYLLDQVFDWGNNHPHDPLFSDGRYQQLVREIWNNIRSALERYEFITQNYTLRHITMDTLYDRVGGSWLASERSFYGRLVEEIRTADGSYW